MTLGSRCCTRVESQTSTRVLGFSAPMGVASGSALVAQDAAEAQAIQRVMGDTLVVANKGNFGEMGAGASALEFVAATQSAVHKVVPPTLNCDSTAADCPINVNVELTAAEQSAVAKLALSKSGQACCVIIDGNVS